MMGVLVFGLVFHVGNVAVAAWEGNWHSCIGWGVAILYTVGLIIGEAEWEKSK